MIEDDYPTYLEVVEDMLRHGDPGADAEADRIGLPALHAAKARCEAAKWPEQHPNDCAWCAHVTATSAVAAKEGPTQ